METKTSANTSYRKRATLNKIWRMLRSHGTPTFVVDSIIELPLTERTWNTMALFISWSGGYEPESYVEGQQIISTYSNEGDFTPDVLIQCDWNNIGLKKIREKRNPKWFKAYCKEENHTIWFIQSSFNTNDFKTFLLDIQKEPEMVFGIEEKAISEDTIRSVLERRGQEKRDRLANYQKGITDNMQTIREFNKEMHKIRSELKEFEVTDEKIEEAIQNIEELKKEKLIKRIRFREGAFYITTNGMYINVIARMPDESGIDLITKQTPLYIGSYVYRVPYNTDENIVIRNSSSTKDKEINTRPHPHATDNIHSNTLCFGELHDEIQYSRNSLDYKRVTELLLSWTTSYSEEGGPYENIQSWYQRASECLMLNETNKETINKIEESKRKLGTI